MVELATTRAAYHCLVFDGSCTSHQVQWSRLAKPPSRTSSALSVNLNSHQSHLHRHKSHRVINIWYAITARRSKWHSHRMQWLMLRHGLNSISSHKIECTQHDITVYMHPQNTEDVLLATANIIDYSLPSTLQRCAINICNILHFDPWRIQHKITTAQPESVAYLISKQA